MTSEPFLRRARRLSAVLVLVACPTIAADLPAGIGVHHREGSARNQVIVDLGADRLAVDAATSDAPPSEIDIAYRLSTAPPPTVREPGELWPSSRSLDDLGTAHAPLVFDDELVLHGASRIAVALDLGRCRTAGDAVLWLPEDRVLVTGELVSTGRVSVTADSDTSAWIDALKRLRDLAPEVVVPGTGSPGGVELLDAQLLHLSEIREAVEVNVLAGGSADDVMSQLDQPWFTAWLEREPGAADRAVELVWAEVSGLRTPWILLEDRQLRPGPSPTKRDPGWSPPRRVLWRNLWPERLAALKVVAPGVEIVPFDTPEEALAFVADADGLVGIATPELLGAGENLRWVQVGSAGVERYLRIPELASGAVLLTNAQRLASPEIAEHVMALIRALARSLPGAVLAQAEGEWRRRELGNSPLNRSLRGKTLLVVGLGGIGTEVARLADGAGMRVTAIRSSRRSGPPFVARVGLAEDLPSFAAVADVVVNCLPMTPETADVFDGELFDAMKPSAFFINVGRGGTVDTDALIDALTNGKIAAAGLDVTDPEPLPEGHPLWSAPNLLITPHYSAWSDVGRDRRWLLFRENLRRFVAGEELLSVVDPERGY